MSSRQQRRRLKRRRASVRVGLVGGGALALTLVPAGVAQAAKPIEVLNLHDSGRGSLRAAIAKAESENSTKLYPAVIRFSSKLSGSIYLKTALQVNGSLDIEGPGARKITVNGSKVPRITAGMFNDASTSDELLAISGLSIDNVISGNQAITMFDSDLVLRDDTFADDGGAAPGGAGAVYLDDTAGVIGGCTFSHDGGYYGGALTIHNSALTIEDSTLAGNHAAADGGALFARSSNVTLMGTTVTGNSVSYNGSSNARAVGYGGGLDIYDGSVLSLKDSIVAGNSASGNPSNSGYPYGGSVHRDIWVDGSGSTMSAEFSLVQHDYIGLPGFDATDIHGRSPDLGALRNNGGPTNTEAPRLGSPVINAGKSFGLKFDQRGDKRTVLYPRVMKRSGGDGTDMGSVELQAPKRRRR